MPVLTWISFIAVTNSAAIITPSILDIKTNSIVNS